MTEFIVHVENRPGRLATITELLSDAGVNIEALAAYGYDGEGVLRLIVDDAATTRRVCRKPASGLSTVLTAFCPPRRWRGDESCRRRHQHRRPLCAIHLPDGIEVAISVDGSPSAVPDLPVTGSLSS